MTSGIVLGIGLCFHNHAPQQTSIRLAFHQPAAHQIEGNDLRWAEEGVGQGLRINYYELGGYGSGLLSNLLIIEDRRFLKNDYKRYKTIYLHPCPKMRWNKCSLCLK